MLVTILRRTEQMTENPCVAGSIPADTTVKKAYFLTKMGFFIVFRRIFVLLFYDAQSSDLAI